ncbi:hypothetical protein CgunFtcFv8_023947 [Champsocephalus gunnari]|uniref:DUF5641 domain-containing protein n=1 Tax=Champsocephalus gunnari TaxID=52237 RepID=A0AAN8HLP4_CHAGU|nr:hypothetical protein CgunFtcFv8_023947 [Champsocephalus gunnari]
MRTAAVRYEEIQLPKDRPAQLQKEDMTEVKVTAATNREFLEWWRGDSIGAACEPKCGGCRCGNCQPGGKEMTLAEERELDIIKAGLTYVRQDSHIASPHWDAKYLWTEDPTSLPNNKCAVEGTVLSTGKQLKQEPEWQAVDKAQEHKMVERAGGLCLKPGVRSGQSGRQETAAALLGGEKGTAVSKTLILPNQTRKEDNKALGIWYRVEEWPIRSAGEVAAQARESVDKLQRKAFSAAITRAQAKIKQRDACLQDPQGNRNRKSQWEKPRAKQTPTRNLTGKTVKDPVEVKRFCSLQKRVGVIAWVWRAARKWLEIKDQPRAESKLEVIWHTRNRDVGDVVWLADQNALRGHYKLARVVSVNTDGKGIVRDVNVRTSPGFPVSVMKNKVCGGYKGHPSRIPATILHRDVRRLVILLPVEEQV